MFENIFEDKMYIIYYSIYLINSFFYNNFYNAIINYILIDKFSANNSAISRIFENLGIFIINSNQKEILIDYNFGIRFVMYILLIFASFIFNEFFVINKCGLANNTKLFLEYKEKKDLSLIEENDEKLQPGIVVDGYDIYSVELDDNNNDEERRTEMSNYSMK